MHKKITQKSGLLTGDVDYNTIAETGIYKIQEASTTATFTDCIIGILNRSGKFIFGARFIKL